MTNLWNKIKNAGIISLVGTGLFLSGCNYSPQEGDFAVSKVHQPARFYKSGILSKDVVFDDEDFIVIYGRWEENMIDTDGNFFTKQVYTTKEVYDSIQVGDKFNKNFQSKFKSSNPHEALDNQTIISMLNGAEKSREFYENKHKGGSQ